MANIEKRAGKFNVRYRVDGSSRRKTFDTLRAASEFKAQVEADAATGKAHDPAKARLTVAQWWPLYTAGRVGLKPGTLSTSKSLYDNHVAKRWADVPLERVTQGQVQAWVASMVDAQTHSPSTIRAVYKDFAAGMKAAVAARYIRETPCVGINLPSIDRDVMTVLDHADVADLADAINPRYRALIIFLAYSGLRIGEACALSWDDVDLDKATVTVRHTLTETAGAGLSLTVPKTRAARRTVPLPQHVIDALRTHEDAFCGPWIFTTATGSHLNPRAFNRRAFATALKAAKLDCRVHDLRHTAISLWIRAGVDLPRVKTWAGHTDAAFTLNTYAKFFPTDDAGILDMLNTNIKNAGKL